MKKPEIKFLLGTQMVHVEGITQEQAADAYSEMVDALMCINEELDSDKNLRDTMSDESRVKLYRALIKAGCSE